MKKTIPAAALAASLVLLSGTAAHADDGQYPAPELSVVVSDSSVQAGETFTVSGGGLESGEKATIVVAQNQSVKNPRGFTMQTAADTRGAFSADLSIDKPGRHWVTVTGEQTGEAGTASVVVTGPPAAKPGKGKDLKVERAAATGSAPSAWGATGLGLLAAAGAAGAVALRRRHS